MAKYRHKIFEMYDFLDEALAELTPRVAQPGSEAATQGLGAFECFDVMHSDGVTQVVLKDELKADADTNIRNDLGKLVDGLYRGCPVLLNFACVTSVCDDAHSELVRFKKRLFNKGNRLAMCCLSPDVRESFFPA